MKNSKSVTVVEITPQSEMLSSVSNFKMFLDLEWDRRNANEISLRLVKDDDRDVILDEAVIKRVTNPRTGRAQWRMRRPDGGTFRVWGIVTWFKATRALLDEGAVFQLALGDLEITFSASDRRNRNDLSAGSTSGEAVRNALKSKTITL